MRVWQRFIAQMAIMIVTVVAVLALAVNGLRGVALVLAIVVLTTISYTALDALKPNARPHDPTWIRRAVTGNLVYVSVIAVLYLVFTALF
jgi:hypothetical protein